MLQNLIADTDCLVAFVFYRFGHLRDLHSFPTRRSSDLAAWPDTHIARKVGPEHAVHVQRRARAVLDAGGVRTAAGRETIGALDRELRDERNTSNPGATADLTGAAICVVLLEGGWRRGEQEADGRA